jgi:origin recognition complex subunit 6
MNRSVEQALTSLIPRHNGALPLELIELASSLLAQSRNKASNLKAEEEIGRTYACANIACERSATFALTHLKATNILCAT